MPFGFSSLPAANHRLGGSEDPRVTVFVQGREMANRGRMEDCTGQCRFPCPLVLLLVLKCPRHTLLLHRLTYGGGQIVYVAHDQQCIPAGVGHDVPWFCFLVFSFNFLQFYGIYLDDLFSLRLLKSALKGCRENID